MHTFKESIIKKSFSDWTYNEEGATVAEYEVDGAFDVAVVVIMAAFLVVERVLGAIEAATVEGSLIALNPKSHGLPTHSARRGVPSRVL